MQDLYKQAQIKFQQANYAEALALLDQALEDLHSADSHQIQQLKAECLIELQEPEDALNIYKDLKLYTQAGFAAILAQDLEQAKSLYDEAEYSPAAKWGKFLVEFFTDPEKLVPTPGYLTFRLHYEATFGYLLAYKLDDYIAKFIEHQGNLETLYPELVKDTGSAYLAARDYNRALELLGDAQKKFRQDTGVYFKSAMAWMNLDRKDKAREFMLKVREMIPGSTMVEDFITQLSGS